MLLRLHDLVLDRQEEIIDLIVLESGKARKHAFDEPLHVALTARYYARTAHQHLDTERVLGVFRVLTRVEVNRVPKGVVGIISPWNYPFTMALCDGLPALLAGNAVVAKPDAQTMLTALLGAPAARGGRLPRRPVAGGRRPGRRGRHPADRAAPTTSASPAPPRPASSSPSECAERLIGCSLELGGKNPMLVLRDADLEQARPRAPPAGSFSNAGQLCVSMERIYVADQVYDRFVERFVARTQAMALGATLDWEVDMGSLISQAAARHRDRRTSTTRSPRAPGCSPAAGPAPTSGPYFYEPTILEGVTPDMTCFGDGDLRPGRLALPLPRRGGRGRPRQRGQLRPQRVDLHPGRRARAGDRPPDQVRHGQRQRGRTAPTFGSSTPRWAACASPAWAGARAPRASTLHRDPVGRAPSGVRPSAPMPGMSEETYAQVMTASLRLLKKLGRA